MYTQATMVTPGVSVVVCLSLLLVFSSPSSVAQDIPPPAPAPDPAQEFSILGKEICTLNEQKVYAVNSTTVQIESFATLEGADTFFFGEPANAASAFYTINPDSGLLKRETNLATLNGKHVVINAPLGTVIQANDRLGFAQEGNEIAAAPVNASFVPLRSVAVSSPLNPDVPLSLNPTPAGLAYGVKADGIVLFDRSTILIRKLTFYATQPPDGYILVGKAIPDENNVVRPDTTTGKKAFVRGHDAENESPMSLNRDYVSEDVMVDLPDEMQVTDINYVSVYCYQFSIDFGTVDLRGSVNQTDTVPAYCPPIGAFF